MNVTWNYTCHTCQSPLDIIVTVPSSCEHALFKLIAYTELNPLNFRNNRAQFKFFKQEKKARRVCEHCRTTKICYWQELRKRECGIRPNKLQNPLRTKTNTTIEILNWFERMHQFFERPDYDEYIPESVTYRVQNLGNLVIRDNNYEIFFRHY